MAIRRLEEYLSCKLFERSPRGILLTEHARYLLPIATKIVELMDNCEEYFASGKDSNQKLSVMFTRGIVKEFASTPITEFRARNPEIFLDLKQGDDLDCEDALDAYAVDLALTAGPIDEKKYKAELVHSSRYGIVVHSDDPIAYRKSIGIGDIEGRPLTVMSGRHKTLSLLNTVAAAAGFKPDIRERVDDALLIFKNAELKQTTGVATGKLTLSFSAHDLSFVPFDDPTLSWNVFLIMRREYKPTPAALLFIQYVQWHRDNILMEG